MSNNKILRKIQRLRIILTARATHREANEEEYIKLRRELIEDPQIKDFLPSFLFSCSNLGDFWSFIQPMFPSYAERREYLVKEFGETISKLQTQVTAPSDKSSSKVLERVNSEYIKSGWQKALERRTSDPDGAITSARTLLESTCKYILEKLGEPYDDKMDLPKLYSTVAKKLDFSPDKQTNDATKRIMGGCATAINGLGRLRNLMSDAHGRGSSARKPDQRHAELAVNLAGTLSTFLIQTFELLESKHLKSRTYS